MTSAWREIESTIERTRDVVTRALGEELARERREALIKRLDDRRLRLLLFGTYNAGKSTLINVLLGKETARVGEVPTTAEVNHYEWEGVELLDSPGLDAPIEHEEVTEEILERTALVVFVLRQGAQDEEQVYARLFQLLREGKDVFLVLNHQAPDEETLLRLHKRTVELLSKMAEKFNADIETAGQIPLYLVNLRTAWKARKKGSVKLLEHSGYVELEQGLREWITARDHEDQRVREMVLEVEAQWLNPALEQLGGDETPELKQWQQQREALQAERGRLRETLYTEVAYRVRAHRLDVRQALEASMGSDGLDELGFEARIQQIFDPVVKDIGHWLAEQLEDAPALQADLGVELDDLLKARDTGGFELPDEVWEGIRHTVTNKEVLKQALLGLRRLKVPYIKGRWEKTLGHWAGRAAIFITIALAAWEMWSAARAQEEENRRRREAALALSQATNEVCQQVEEVVQKATREALDQVYSPRLGAVEKAIEALASKAQERAHDRELLLQAQAKLRGLTA